MLAALAPPRHLLAHPLGNFSISQYSALRFDDNQITVHYVVDIAEIPTFQEIQETGLVAKLGDPSVKAYVEKKAVALRDGLTLEVNGRRVVLQAKSEEIIFPEGAGGLPTIKLAVVYSAKLPDRKSTSYRITYRDNNFPGRAGWKEIIAVGSAGAKLLQSSVPEADRSARLSNYPTDLLNSPPQVLEARVEFEPKVNSPSVMAGTVLQARENTVPLAAHNAKLREIASVTAKQSSEPVELKANKQSTPKNAFTELIATKHLNWRLVLFAFVVAAALGGLHALEPGHGKTLVAAYLVGSRGTMKHAIWLGSIVTMAHTAGVYLLGAITLYASKYIVPEQLYPWLTLISGLMILALGCGLFVRRCRGDGLHHHHHDRRDGAYHKHHHDHAHPHLHRHAHHHHHELAEELSLKQLLTLGISGGIVPCPAALVVLLSAVSLQRIGFGLLLIVAFSVGLAAVLIAVGMLVVYARSFAAQLKPGVWTTRWLPLTSSAFIMLFGFALAWQAFQSAGLKLLPIL